MGRAKSTSASDLLFRYDAWGANNQIDQTFVVRNQGPAAVTLDLTFVPLDAQGRELDGVTTHSAYGIDRGMQVIPPEFTDLDVLHFSGDGCRDVADVRVTVNGVQNVGFPDKIKHVVVAERLGGGRVVGPAEVYDSVRLTNPNRREVFVRIALIEYEEPFEDKPQQAVDVRPLGGLVAVPGRGTAIVAGPGRFPEAFVSVKPYFSL